MDHALHPDEIDALNGEWRYCKRAQSWSPGSTRSAWWTEVRDYVDAVKAIHEHADSDEADDEEREAELQRAAQDAYTAALAEGHRLAQEKADQLLDEVKTRAEAIIEGAEDLEDALGDLGDLEQQGDRDMVEVKVVHGEEGYGSLTVSVTVYTDARVVAPDVLCPKGGEATGQVKGQVGG